MQKQQAANPLFTQCDKSTGITATLLFALAKKLQSCRATASALKLYYRCVMPRRTWRREYGLWNWQNCYNNESFKVRWQHHFSGASGDLERGPPLAFNHPSEWLTGPIWQQQRRRGWSVRKESIVGPPKKCPNYRNAMAVVVTNNRIVT